MEDVRVGSLNCQRLFWLPPVFTLDRIPVSTQDVCDRVELSARPHPCGVELPETDVGLREADLLIGANCPQLLVPDEARKPEGDLCAPASSVT